MSQDADVAVVEKDSIVANLSKCIAMLQHCVNPEDAKKFLDVGIAAQVWAERQKLGIEVRNSATEFVLRAERRLGELLKQTDRNPGGRPVKKPVTEGVQVSTLEENGISRNLSSRAQRIANVPEEIFEAAISKEKEEANEISTSKITTMLLTGTVQLEEKPYEVNKVIARITGLIDRELSRAPEEARLKITDALKRYLMGPLYDSTECSDKALNDSTIGNESNPTESSLKSAEVTGKDDVADDTIAF